MYKVWQYLHITLTLLSRFPINTPIHVTTAFTQYKYHSHFFVFSLRQESDCFITICKVLIKPGCWFCLSPLASTFKLKFEQRAKVLNVLNLFSRVFQLYLFCILKDLTRYNVGRLRITGSIQTQTRWENECSQALFYIQSSAMFLLLFNI